MSRFKRLRDKGNRNPEVGCQHGCRVCVSDSHARRVKIKLARIEGKKECLMLVSDLDCDEDENDISEDDEGDEDEFISPESSQ